MNPLNLSRAKEMSKHTSPRTQTLNLGITPSAALQAATGQCQEDPLRVIQEFLRQNLDACTLDDARMYSAIDAAYKLGMASARRMDGGSYQGTR